MNIAELYNSGPEPNVKRALNYITDLAANTGHNILGWDITKVFGDEMGVMVTSYSEMNKRFFEQVKVDSTIKTVEKLTEEQVRLIKSFERTNRDNHLRTYDQDISHKLNDIRRMANNIEARQSELAQIYARKRAVSLDYCKDTNDILSLNFFEFYSLDEMYGYMTYVTPEIVLNYKRGDGKEMRLNFGKFKIRLYPAGAKILVLKHEKNIDYGGHIHPFIGNSGVICWGTAQEVASEYIAKGEWKESMRLLASLLTTYPGGTPYVTLEDFYFSGIDCDSGNRAPWLTEEEKGQVDPLYYCEHCEDNGEDEHSHDTHEHEFHCSDCDVDYTSGEGHSCEHECGECGSTYYGDADDHVCMRYCSDCEEEYTDDEGHTCPEEEEETPTQQAVATPATGVTLDANLITQAYQSMAINGIGVIRVEQSNE